ncbi:MAG TPA: glutaredoxin family protein [Tepidisphaeraceae bacterium]|nr:glutaredoxin family protein [Tepidisphaeraceae bacterium]
MKLVTLYTKPECHLCDVVKQVIHAVSLRQRFRLEIRNILDDPADFEKYKQAIPVVCVDGQEIARYRMTAHDLEAALARE